MRLSGLRDTRAYPYLARVLYKIADCARIRFLSARNRRSARTGRRPRKFDYRSSTYCPTRDGVVERPLRALRANHVFGTDEKRIRTKNTVMNKTNDSLGLP
jgi:hypothetical protein